MRKKLVKNAICFLILFILMAPIMVAAQSEDDFGVGDLEGSELVLSKSSDLPGIVVNVINIVLGLLALIAVIIVLIGGFEWMTAGGNEDQVGTAKKRLTYGLIGLAIIFLAYGIVTFVIGKLVNLPAA